VGPIRWRALRSCTLNPSHHPRGAAHVAAASGLVCANGRAYVVADDEHHLAIYSDLESPGRLLRLAPLAEGELPADPAQRKRRKPDLEILMRLPGGGLLALGSGSSAQRERGWFVALDPRGEPARRPRSSSRPSRPSSPCRVIDLTPLYTPLRTRLGEINIEGAMCLGVEFVLLHRGGEGEWGANVVVAYAMAQLRSVTPAPTSPRVGSCPWSSAA
jgi:hypothetical protein